MLSDYFSFIDDLGNLAGEYLHSRNHRGRMNTPM